MSTEAEFAWAVGLFEGEGCIFPRRSCGGVQLSVVMCDLDVLKRFARITGFSEPTACGGGINYERYASRMGKAPQVREFLTKALPYLGERRACKALDAFDKLDKCL